MVETDYIHPITVLNLTDMSVVGQYPFDGYIRRCSFVNDAQIMIATPSTFYLLDMTTATITFLRNLGYSYTTSSWDMHKNRLFLCHNSSVSTYSFTAEYLPDQPYDPYKDPEVVLPMTLTEAELKQT